MAFAWLRTLSRLAMPFLILRNVNAVVPVIVYEVDTLGTRAVLVAVLGPISRVSGWNMKIDGRANHTYHGFDDDRLRIDQFRMGKIANFDSTVKPRLADRNRNADIGRIHGER
jgi:hypothetical protein